MLYMFKFPDIGEGITEGKILEWYVKKGQSIKEGDPVVKMETDKVVADIPSPRSGVVKNVFGKVGDIVNVHDALIEIEVEGTSVVEDAESRSEEVAESKMKMVEERGFGVVGQIEDAKTDAFLPATGEGMEEAVTAKRTLVDRKALATPVARKLAKDLAIDINAIAGTGPGGRVMKADIQRAFDEKQRGPKAGAKTVSRIPDELPGRTEIEELSQLRKTIAARMVESWYTAPHTTAFEEVEISRLIAIREDQKDKLADQGVKLTYMAFVIRAVVLSLKKHRKLNCKLDMQHNRVIYNNFYNIGFALDTPDGLIVPVIKDADKKSIIEIARELADKTERGRQRKLTLDELRDSTFSVTNYGSIAGIHGVPIMNYPDVAILGVGRIVQKPVVKDGQIVPGNVLPLSLSVDHRIVDGADAGRFLRDLMALLGDPLAMLVM
jgi:pyruvate dehydrogenase E2 component (dihydrolipoamide acetyltransferase)